MSVGQVFSAQILFSGSLGYAMCNFHWVVTSDPLNHANAATLRTHLRDRYTDQFAHIISDSGQMLRIKVFDVSGSDPHTSAAFAFSSGVASSPLPSFVAYRFTVWSGIHGRPGWCHIPYVPHSKITDGQAISSWLPTLATVASNFTSGLFFTGTQYEQCIWTRPNSTYPAGRYRLITRAAYTGVSTQRSRRGNRNDHLQGEFGI